MNRFFLLAVLFALACSLVIQPGEERCSADEGCPTGMSCFEGLCEVGTMCVEGTVEACNMVDDDCDDIIDEDLGETPEACNMRDDDCDGVTDEGFGGVSEVCNGVDDDCDGIADEDVPVMFDDCDGVTDEGTTEICNNLDDDCDDIVDEQDAAEPPLCAADTICIGSCQTPSCDNDVSLACSPELFCNNNVDPPVCDVPPPQRCDNDAECGAGQLCFDGFEGGGICFDATPLGNACESDVSCVDGTFCANLAAVGLSGKTCTNTCCVDSDCPSNAICRSGFLGARLCVPTVQAGTPIPGRCTAHSDCASGYCRLYDEECQAVCSTDQNCAIDEACISTLAFGDEVTNGCFLAGDRADAGSDCDSSVDCRSVFCNAGTCFAPCSAAGQCPSGQGCTSFTSTTGEFVNFCDRENTDGLAGTACTSNGGCDSLRCHEGLCVAPCCSSGQCQSGRACQPIQVGDQWPTFCITP
ncbi:MAG: hypothetical protein ACI9KE_003863 [Polyangiales bacterium]